VIAYLETGVAFGSADVISTAIEACKHLGTKAGWDSARGIDRLTGERFKVLPSRWQLGISTGGSDKRLSVIRTDTSQSRRSRTRNNLPAWA
jgi:hypothetical protein